MERKLKIGNETHEEVLVIHMSTRSRQSQSQALHTHKVPGSLTFKINGCTPLTLVNCPTNSRFIEQSDELDCLPIIIGMPSDPTETPYDNEYLMTDAVLHLTKFEQALRTSGLIRAVRHPGNGKDSRKGKKRKSNPTSEVIVLPQNGEFGKRKDVRYKVILPDGHLADFIDGQSTADFEAQLQKSLQENAQLWYQTEDNTNRPLDIVQLAGIVLNASEELNTAFTPIRQLCFEHIEIGVNGQHPSDPNVHSVITEA